MAIAWSAVEQRDRHVPSPGPGEGTGADHEDHPTPTLGPWLHRCGSPYHRVCASRWCSFLRR